MKEFTFQEVVDMFDKLLKKNYTMKEIMAMPITVGAVEVK